MVRPQCWVIRLSVGTGAIVWPALCCHCAGLRSFCSTGRVVLVDAAFFLFIPPSIQPLSFGGGGVLIASIRALPKKVHCEGFCHRVASIESLVGNR
mgnify:CR=1 FL=1